MITWEPPISEVKKRTQQQDIAPSAIKPAQLAQTTIVNTNAEQSGPFAMTNGDSLTVQSIITNSANPAYRLGGVPYCIVFFQGSVDSSNIIGYGVTGDYTINGPLSMPIFTPYAVPGSPGGSDGNNLVFVTEIRNDSAGSVNVYFITNTRVYNVLGGGLA